MNIVQNKLLIITKEIVSMKIKLVNQNRDRGFQIKLKMRGIDKHNILMTENRFRYSVMVGIVIIKFMVIAQCIHSKMIHKVIMIFYKVS